MKKLLALLLASLMLICLVACNKDKEDDETQNKNTKPVLEEVMTYENFSYAANESGMYEIVGYTPTSTELVSIEVPAEIDGRAVVGIGESAFKASKYLKEIKLPASVTYIDDYAFFDCDYLSAVSLSTVTKIGMGAFENCSALESVTFSADLTEIGMVAFKDCVALKNVTLPAKLTAISAGTFYNCDALTEIVIPESVKTIGDSAFYHCDKLATITVPATTTEFGVAIFHLCAEELTINTPADSAFDKYVKEHNYNVVAPTPAN